MKSPARFGGGNASETARSLDGVGSTVGSGVGTGLKTREGRRKGKLNQKGMNKSQDKYEYYTSEDE